MSQRWATVTSVQWVYVLRLHRGISVPATLSYDLPERGDIVGIPICCMGAHDEVAGPGTVRSLTMFSNAGMTRSFPINWTTTS